jgi:hypothetical protein
VSIPVNAQVRAVRDILACLQTARGFMEEQAPARFEKLQMEVMRARTLLSLAPAGAGPPDPLKPDGVEDHCRPSEPWTTG